MVGVAHYQPGDDDQAIDLTRRQLAECLTVTVSRPLNEISMHLRDDFG